MTKNAGIQVKITEIQSITEFCWNTKRLVITVITIAQDHNRRQSADTTMVNLVRTRLMLVWV
jgi:hypothetical protein